jgi:GNAT superfamily N-acetyltransferase
MIRLRATTAKDGRCGRGLDRESIYTRFFSYRGELTDAKLDRIMRFDPENEVALVVTTGAGNDEIVIGAGRYIASGSGQGERAAEVAFMVEEDYHGLGIAGRLLRHLAEIAREKGIATFEADVLAKNKSMLVVFARSGLPMRKRHEGDTVHVTLSLKGDPAHDLTPPSRTAVSRLLSASMILQRSHPLMIGPRRKRQRRIPDPGSRASFSGRESAVRCWPAACGPRLRCRAPPAADEWREFQARDCGWQLPHVALAAIAGFHRRFQGSMLLAAVAARRASRRSDRAGDSATGRMAAPLTDERGDQAFSELRGEGTATGNRISGNFLADGRAATVHAFS